MKTRSGPAANVRSDDLYLADPGSRVFTNIHHAIVLLPRRQGEPSARLDAGGVLHCYAGIGAEQEGYRCTSANRTGSTKGDFLTFGAAITRRRPVQAAALAPCGCDGQRPFPRRATPASVFLRLPHPSCHLAPLMPSSRGAEFCARGSRRMTLLHPVVLHRGCGGLKVPFGLRS